MRLIVILYFSFLMVDSSVAAPAVVKAKLLSVTPVPKLKDIDTYSRAMSVYAYELQQVLSGKCEEKTLYVLKWSIWQKRVLPSIPVKVGGVEELRIDLLSAYKEYAHDRIIGTVADTSKVLYLDLNSIPKGVDVGELKLGDEMVTRGVKEDWLFLNDDVRHMKAGEYWKLWNVGGEIDVLDVVLDFQKRLKIQGVDLLMVPVPIKANIYSDYFMGGAAKIRQNAYVEVLRKAGVSVVDLHEVFHKSRQTNSRALYCKGDSHWSPEGCNVAAEAVSKHMSSFPWYEKAERKEYELALTSLLEIKGDLTQELKGMEETLPVEYVSDAKEKLIANEQAKSPVILLGDSHTLVFSDATAFFCDGAGVSDYLAQHSGIAVDTVASVGSGMNAARGKLYRGRSVHKAYPDYWKGKKLLIWCFSERELSKPVGLSVKIPVMRK